MRPLPSIHLARGLLAALPLPAGKPAVAQLWGAGGGGTAEGDWAGAGLAARAAAGRLQRAGGRAHGTGAERGHHDGQDGGDGRVACGERGQSGAPDGGGGGGGAGARDPAGGQPQPAGALGGVGRRGDRGRAVRAGARAAGGHPRARGVHQAGAQDMPQAVLPPGAGHEDRGAAAGAAAAGGAQRPGGLQRRAAGAGDAAAAGRQLGAQQRPLPAARGRGRGGRGRLEQPPDARVAGRRAAAGFRVGVGAGQLDGIAPTAAAHPTFAAGFVGLRGCCR
mmetsp:Transcript_30576/g.77131  ORF Transcript_30576/g.77131 Transcript_30576/m.77131 type:complete len:278 (-) Transcript_30576:56-889(-)